MNILAIDTAKEVCSVALKFAGKVSYLSSSTDPATRSQNLLTMIKQLTGKISMQDLAGFAFAAGPGSLTGLKVASSIMQAFSLCYQKPIFKISTLHALAVKAYVNFGIKSIMPCINAHMGQIYYGLYKVQVVANSEILVPLQADQVAEPGQLTVPPAAEQMLVVGDGIQLLPEFTSNFHNLIKVVPDLEYDAKDLLQIAEDQYKNYGIIKEDAIPFYLNSYN